MNTTNKIDLETAHKMLMLEIKNQSAQLLTGSLQIELHFLHGKIIKIKSIQQKYLKT